MSYNDNINVLCNIENNFTQIRNDILVSIQDPYDLTVYILIMKYADYRTKKCYPSINRLTDESGMSRNRLIKSIKSLEKRGFLSIEKAVNKPNKYTLLEPNLGSARDEPPELGSARDDTGSASQGSQVVHEKDTNEIHRTILTNEIKIDIGAKLKTDVNFQKEWLKEKLQAHTDKYTKQELNEFYLYWVSPCDISGKTNLTDALKGKKSTFNVGQRLATARKRGFLTSKQNNSNYSRPQTFQEIEAENFKKVMNAPNPFILQGVNNEQSN